MHYEKPAFTPQQHLDLLKERGLIIPDEQRILNYLKSVGYYRLTGYMFHLQSKDGTHTFKENTSFDHIVQHYQFDNKLRHLLLSYMDRIEVGFRTCLIDTYSLQYGFFWYTDPARYIHENIYHYIITEVSDRFKDPQERFLKAYRAKYYSESFPPSNMAMEILSFGKLSKLYMGLINDDEKQCIAKELTLPNSAMLTSWLIHLTHVRNACAHHARIWNRRFTADRPKIPSRKDYKFHGELPIDFNQSIYGVIAMMARLLTIINPSNSFIVKLTVLLENYPHIETAKMGFPANWQTEPAWKNRIAVPEIEQ